MELVRGNLEDSLAGLRVGSSKECLSRFLDAQRELFHSQIDQLQRIVVTQCKLTGVNPLSQEMAAGALSIKIGKRPRDLLNPKAIKYMQSIFSIKDTISKKETREISALCGVTITQVREFFASHRSRVRKLVRLSREKALKSNASSGIRNGYSSSPDHSTPVSKQTCENAVDLRNTEECSQAAVNTVQPLNAIQQTDQVSRESANINSVTDSLSCSPQDATIPAIDSDDRNFLENIFSLMRNEETFSGQVKLMEWILQIQNSAVLHWFLTKGGVMILATWLSQAALEEQTTVLLVIFKVLCHLPLHKALPAQMSAILQTVNKLRFYRTSDISNKARVLLSRWSKMFVRSQALKRPFSTNYSSDIHKEIIRKKRIDEILSDESWLSKVDLPEDVLALGYEGSDYGRKSDPKNTLKLLPATCNDSSKKQGLSVSCPKTKERRKVLLVEQPEQKHAGRGVQVARAVPVKSSRPISADDIQKAKMRAIFMQRKYGNKDTPANENCSQKNINQKIPIGSQANDIFMPTLPKSERDEDKKSVLSATQPSDAMQKMLVDSKPSLTSLSLKPSLTSSDSKPCLPQELSSEKLNNDHLAWQMPPVMKINSLWRVGTGESSKEMEVQTARIRREKETFYLTATDIPTNPKDPWDMEMDFDDSLTPEIPTEQPPDVDSLDIMVEGEHPPVVTPDIDKDNAESERPVSATTSAPVIAGAPEPDLELLAVLLKNPELVFALTSGQGQHNLTNTETVALLDVLKKSGGGLTGLLNGLGGMTSQTSEPTSLPSPTPMSERTRMEWQTETSEQPASTTKNLQLQHGLPGINIVTDSPAATPPTPSPSLVSLPGTVPIAGRVMPSVRMGILSTPQLAEVPKPSSQLPVQLHTAGSLPLPQNLLPPMSLVQHVHKPELILPLKHLPVNTVVSPLLWQETFNLEQVHGHKHTPVAAVPSVSPLLPTPPKVQPVLIQEPPMRSPVPSQWSPGTAGGRGREPILGSWHGQPNGLLETPAPNSHFSDDQGNANIFSTGSGRTHKLLLGRVVEANGLLDSGELEPWSPERSPLIGRENPSLRNYPEPRRGGQYGREDRPERSRQYNAGHRDRHRSGRRWRDRDRWP